MFLEKIKFDNVTVRDVIFNNTKPDDPIYLLGHSKGGSLVYEIGLLEERIDAACVLNGFIVNSDRFRQVPI